MYGGDLMQHTNRHAQGLPPRVVRGEIPIQPNVMGWVLGHARPSNTADRDRVVAQALESLNAQQYRASATRSAELAAYEARVRVLTEQMPAILWSTDTELRVTSSVGRGRANVGAEPATSLSRRLV